MGLRATRRKRRFLKSNLRSEGPLLLAFDTSGQFLNIGLQKGNSVLAVCSSYQPFSHAEAILPAIDLLLESQQFVLDDVDAFGVCLGPGSFTGLRVGMTTLKSFCFSTGKPAVGLPATVVLAAALKTDLHIGCLIDARKGEVYSALLQHRTAHYPAQATELLQPEASTPEEGLARLLAELDGPVILAGSACTTYARTFAGFGEGRVEFAGPEFDRVNPAVLATLCMDEFNAGRTQDAAALEPAYVGKPPIHKHRG